MRPPRSSDRARILFAIPAMGLGGSECVIATLLRHIDPNRFEPHLVVLDSSGPRLQDLPRDVTVHALAVKHARQAVLPIAGLCWKHRPQVVLSTSAHMNSAVIAARALMPRGTVVLTREGADLHSPDVAYSRSRLFICKHLYRHADLVICQSEYMKEDLIQRFGLAASKVVRIYNPVDVELINELAASEPNPLPADRTNLVSVGHFTYEKGVDILLRCMPRICKAVPNAMLTLVGEGPDLAVLRSIESDLNLGPCVQFAGVQRNPYPFMKHADCFVLPSRSEALPNVILEALAVSTPVATFNCTGALSEISSCTRGMWIAKGRTCEELAAAILTCVTATRSQPKIQPPPQFEARFGVRTVVEQYEQVLLSAVPTVPNSESFRRASQCAE